MPRWSGGGRGQQLLVRLSSINSGGAGAASTNTTLASPGGEDTPPLSAPATTTPPSKPATISSPSAISKALNDSNGLYYRPRRRPGDLRLAFPRPDPDLVKQSASLEVPDSSPSVPEARRKSLAVAGRSRSLGVNNNSSKQLSQKTSPRLQQQQSRCDSSAASSCVRLERSNTGDRGSSNSLLGNNANNNSSSSNTGVHNRVLSAFKAKYSQSVVGYGAENCSWSFLLSLPHLVMVSNLQSLLGVGGGSTGANLVSSVSSKVSKPSLQPNDYMDGVIANMKADMKERGMNELALPDQEYLVSLYNGQVTGLTNLSRRGDALLEADKDHFLLSFALQAKEIRCAYWWRKQRLKGEVCAIVQKIIMNMKIRQMVGGSTTPELIDFEVAEVAGVQVHLVGLGPLNWMVRRALRAFLRRHLRTYLEREGRELIAQELAQQAQQVERQQSQSTAGAIASFLGF